MKPVSKPTIFTFRYALYQISSREAALKAAGFYQQVIAKDASFTPAYAGLAAAYAAIRLKVFATTPTMN